MTSTFHTESAVSQLVRCELRLERSRGSSGNRSDKRKHDMSTWRPPQRQRVQNLSHAANRAISDINNHMARHALLCVLVLSMSQCAEATIKSVFSKKFVRKSFVKKSFVKKVCKKVCKKKCVKKSL